jgi:hypothetical protein
MSLVFARLVLVLKLKAACISSIIAWGCLFILFIRHQADLSLLLLVCYLQRLPNACGHTTCVCYYLYF